MLGYYKYSREFIVNKIKKCQLTKDGHFYCPDFPKWNSAQGNYLEKNYTFTREETEAFVLFLSYLSMNFTWHFLLSPVCSCSL